MRVGLGDSWGAWMSSADVRAIDRLADGPYLLLGTREVVVPDKGSLLKGTLNRAIDLTESGNRITVGSDMKTAAHLYCFER